MSKRELIAQELGRLSEHDLDRVLAFVRKLEEDQAEAEAPAVAAESALAKDWLSPEEDAAWANLRKATPSSSTSLCRISARRSDDQLWFSRRYRETTRSFARSPVKQGKTDTRSGSKAPTLSTAV